MHGITRNCINVCPEFIWVKSCRTEKKCSECPNFTLTQRFTLSKPSILQTWVFYPVGYLCLGHLPGVNIFFFFGNYTLMADCDLRNSTLASKACFGPYPLIKCKTHQIWSTLTWKSYFFGFFFFIFHEKSKLSRQTLPQPKRSNKLYPNIYSSIFQNIHPCLKVLL